MEIKYTVQNLKKSVVSFVTYDAKDIRRLRNLENFLDVGLDLIRQGNAGVRGDGAVMKVVKACYYHLPADCSQGQKGHDMFDRVRCVRGSQEKY